MANATNPKRIKFLTVILFTIIALFPFGLFTQIPFLPVRLYIQDILIVGVWIILLSLRNFTWIRKQSLFFPSIVFTGVSIISLLVSLFSLPLLDVAVSSLYLLRWIAYTGVGIASWIVVQNDPKIKQKILKGMVLAGTTASVFGLVQYIIYPDLRNLYYLGWDPHFLRIFGTFFDPNFLGLIITLTLIYLATTDSIKTNYAKIFFWIVNGLALALTYSRGSYLAFFGAFLAFFYLQKKQKLILAMICIGLAIFFILPQSGKSEGVKLGRLSTIQSRIKNMNEGLNLFTSSPLLGVGFNTLRFHQAQQPQIFGGTVIPNNAAGGVENSFIFLLATTGVIGLLAYIWLLRNIFLLRETVLTISLIAICLHSLFSNSLFYPWVMIWLWFMVGTSLSSRHSSDSRQHQ